MGKSLFLGLILSLVPIRIWPVSDSLFVAHKLHRRSVGETFLFSQLPNVVIYSANRWIFGSDFAFTSGHSIARNFNHRPYWDNDLMGTNLLGHPYHGSLYFNAARSGGYSFWESVPFAIAGSFVWEYFGERDPPSKNDLIATPIGGAAIGEVSHRVASLLFETSKGGIKGIVASVVGLTISPMDGLQRIFSGEFLASKTSRKSVCEHRTLFNLQIGVGAQSWHRAHLALSARVYPVLHIDFCYGDPYREENRLPYDYFTLDAAFNFSSNQPFLANTNLLGLLWGKANYDCQKERGNLWGIFQYFSFYESNPLKVAQPRPYLFAETASAGIGWLTEGSCFTPLLYGKSALHLGAVLLGSTQSMPDAFSGRGYAFGSGYSFRIKEKLIFRNHFWISASLYGMHLFSWKGNPSGEYNHFLNPLYADIQGVKGSNLNLVVESALGYDFSGMWSVRFACNASWHKGWYGQFPNRSTAFFGWNIGLYYTLD